MATRSASIDGGAPVAPQVPAGADALPFDGFVILPGERWLLVGGGPVKIGARAFDLLLPLIGRETELQELLQMLERERWVTVTGAGGMGKTRLAEAAGRSLAAQLGAWRVELAAVSDPRFVPNAVAQALGATIADADRPVEALVAALRGQSALLILDNCEHLIVAVAELCTRLLRELPLLRVLVTSQELLRGADEVVYKLGPLALPDGSGLAAARQAGSLRLLHARVKALSRGFEINADNLDADEWDVLDTLASLIDKSMVQVKGLDRPRYLLLETTRAYALEQLVAREETDDALARHAHATRQVCMQATRRRDTEAIWDEIANIRAAFAWAMNNHDAALAVALANESSVVLALGGLVGEVLQRLVEVEPLVSNRLPSPLVARYWQWLGRFCSDGRLPSALVLRCSSDAFRASSQTARGPVQARAYLAAGQHLAGQAGEPPAMVAPITSELELAQLLTVALSGCTEGR